MAFSAEELKKRKEASNRRKAEVAAMKESSTIFNNEPMDHVTQADSLERAVAKDFIEHSTSEALFDSSEETAATTSGNRVIAIGTVEYGEVIAKQFVEEEVTSVKLYEEQTEGVAELEDAMVLEDKSEESEPDQIPSVSDPEAKHEEPEPVLTTEPSLGDTTVFQKLTNTSEKTGIDGNDSYAELIENMVSTQCQLSGVKNLDLTTFGLRAQVLSFPNLTVMEYGVHKFLGAPFTEEEENLIIHRLGLYVAQSEKTKIVVRAVQEVKDTRGMSFYSLLFNEEIAQKFANMFNYTVHANLREPDVSKLVLVIQK